MIPGRIHRGVALLLVLGTLALVTTTLGVLVVSAAQNHRASRLSAHERMADDLLRATEPLIIDWLASKSPRAVVAPEAAEPKMQVAAIDWIESQSVRSIRAAAWDLHGMLPSKASSASPLWLAVNTELRDLELGDTQTLLHIKSSPVPVHPEIGPDNQSLGARLAVSHSTRIRRSRPASRSHDQYQHGSAAAARGRAPAGTTR